MSSRHSELPPRARARSPVTRDDTTDSSGHEPLVLIAHPADSSLEPMDVDPPRFASDTGVRGVRRVRSSTVHKLLGPPRVVDADDPTVGTSRALIPYDPSPREDKPSSPNLPEAQPRQKVLRADSAPLEAAPVTASPAVPACAVAPSVPAPQAFADVAKTTTPPTGGAASPIATAPAVAPAAATPPYVVPPPLVPDVHFADFWDAPVDWRKCLTQYMGTDLTANDATLLFEAGGVNNNYRLRYLPEVTLTAWEFAFNVVGFSPDLHRRDKFSEYKPLNIILKHHDVMQRRSKLFLRDLAKLDKQITSKESALATLKKHRDEQTMPPTLCMKLPKLSDADLAALDSHALADRGLTNDSLVAANRHLLQGLITVRENQLIALRAKRTERSACITFVFDALTSPDELPCLDVGSPENVARGVLALSALFYAWDLWHQRQMDKKATLIQRASQSLSARAKPTPPVAAATADAATAAPAWTAEDVTRLLARVSMCEQELALVKRQRSRPPSTSPPSSTTRGGGAKGGKGRGKGKAKGNGKPPSKQANSPRGPRAGSGGAGGSNATRPLGGKPSSRPKTSSGKNKAPSPSASAASHKRRQSPARGSSSPARNVSFSDRPSTLKARGRRAAYSSRSPPPSAMRRGSASGASSKKK